MLQKPEAPTHLSVQPLYVQLREALVARIANGEWKSGSALPNEIALAREFGLSPGTVRKALDWLVAAGIIVRQQGRGTFVTEQTSTLRYERLCRPDGRVLAMDASPAEVEMGKPLARERERLGLASDDDVFRLKRTRSADKTLVMVEQIAVPAGLFPMLAGKRTVAYDLAKLAKEGQYLLGAASEWVSAGPLPGDIAPLLNATPGEIVVVLERVIVALSGTPLELRTAWCKLGDHHYRSIID